MNKPNVIKYLMIAGGVLLVLSLIMTAAAMSKPVHLNQKTNSHFVLVSEDISGRRSIF
jgi:hypothetical protein